MEKYFDSIDICKFLCSILVIIIHCQPLLPFSWILNEYTVNCLCRIAVPVFYSISGFFLARKIQSGKKDVIRYEIGLIKIYLLWSLIYIIFHFVEYVCNNGINLTELIFRFIPQQIWLTAFRASNYQFWYLLALIYAIPFVSILAKASAKFKMFVLSFLWIIQTFSYTYRLMFPHIFDELFVFSQKIDAVYNTFFLAIPLLLIGVIAYDTYQKVKVKKWGVLRLYL